MALIKISGSLKKYGILFATAPINGIGALASKCFLHPMSLTLNAFSLVRQETVGSTRQPKQVQGQLQEQIKLKRR